MAETDVRQHSYDPRNERCVMCGIDRSALNTDPCKGKLRYTETVNLSPGGPYWLRRPWIPKRSASDGTH